MAINYGKFLSRVAPGASSLTDDERNAVARRGLLSLGLGILGSRSGGSFGTALSDGLRSGLLAVDDGVQGAENTRYKNEILARTRQGMERNTAIEQAQQGILGPDGKLDQGRWAQWAQVDPVGALEFRNKVEPKAQDDWTMAQVGDGTGGLLDVWINKNTREVRDLQNNPISGGLLSQPEQQRPTGGLLGADVLPGLEQAVMQVESGGNPAAVSPRGALGTMQTMPSTLTDPGYGVSPARDRSPAEMERVGKEYLQAMQRQYGDPRLALAAYNWGPGNVDRAVRTHGGSADAVLANAPAETRAYVPKVLGLAQRGSSAPQIGRRPPKEAAQSERYRTLTPQEVASFGLPQGTVAQQGPTGQIQIVNRPKDTPASGAGMAIQNEDGTTTYIPAGKTTEGERNAAGFYQRMVNSTKELTDLTASGYDPNNLRDRVGAGIDNIPLVGGAIAPLGRAATTSQGQQYQQAAMNWIRANLRKESGAAIGVKEADDEYKNYFPVLGDSPEVIEQKARNRAVVEQAMRSAAGGALPAPQPGGSSAPPVGTIKGGYRFKGGDPAQQSNWEKI